MVIDSEHFLAFCAYLRFYYMYLLLFLAITTQAFYNRKKLHLQVIIEEGISFVSLARRIVNVGGDG